MELEIDIKEEPVAWDDRDGHPNTEDRPTSFESIYKTHFPTGIEFVRLATNMSPVPTSLDKPPGSPSNQGPLPLQECNFPAFAAAWIKLEPPDENDVDPLCESKDWQTGETSSSIRPLSCIDVSPPTTPPPSTSRKVPSLETTSPHEPVVTLYMGAQADDKPDLVTCSKPKRTRKPCPRVYDCKVKCDFCKWYFIKSSLERHVKAVHSGECPYQCKMCNSSWFATAEELKSHERLHKDPKPFFCEICNARFTKRGEMTVHLRYHTGNNCFTCLVCDAKFVTKNKLKIHERTHNGQRPYECATCDKAFTQSTHLKDHINTKHGPGKIFECDLCPLKFTRSNHLADHRRTHTGEKPYPCTECDKSFARRTHLVRHMLRHSGARPFICDTCTANFARRDDLERHIRSHTNDKRYECNDCGSRFLMSHHLKVHRRTHLAQGARTWVCKLCSEEFSAVGDLMSHTRKHNKAARMAALNGT